ncbi:MAG: hypothetical protein ACYTA3_12475, partial [Planctomycetota bacterium]
MAKEDALPRRHVVDVVPPAVGRRRRPRMEYEDPAGQETGADEVARQRADETQRCDRGRHGSAVPEPFASPWPVG